MCLFFIWVVFFFFLFLFLSETYFFCLNWWKGLKGEIGHEGGQFRPSGLAEANGEHGSETFLLGNKFLVGIMRL
jgi:hypothetical protein